jgi:hypothetical protein
MTTPRSSSPDLGGDEGQTCVGSFGPSALAWYVPRSPEAPCAEGAWSKEDG